MKRKLLFALTFVWSSLAALAFPIAVMLIVPSLAGYSKGWDYDLGEERSVSVLFGIMLLALWNSLTVPPAIYLFSRLGRAGRKPVIAALIWFTALAVLCILMTGGFYAFFHSAFHIGFLNQGELFFSGGGLPVFCKSLFVGPFSELCC